AVDNNPGGERIIPAGDGLGEFETAAALSEWLAVGAGENFQKPAWDFGSAIVGAAADEDLGVVGIRLVHQGGGAGRGTKVGGIQFIYLALQFAVFLTDGSVKQAIKFVPGQIRGRVGRI